MTVRERLRPLYGKRELIQGILAFLFYALGYQIASLLVTPPAIFPIHAAVGLAALCLWGLRLWPFILLSGFASHVFLGTGPLVALFLAVGNSLEVIFGAYLLKRARFNPELLGIRDIFSLLLVAVFASAVAPTVGYAGLTAREVLLNGNGLVVPWIAWWFGHMWSLLVIAPFLIRWLSKARTTRTPPEIIEAAAALVTIIVIMYAASFMSVGQIGGVSLVYILLVPLFWIALRRGPSIMTLALIVVSAMGLVGTYINHTPDMVTPLGQQLYLLQVFLIVISLICLILTAVTEERRSAALALRAHIGKLEDFISVFAHEIRNPLAPILSSLELLKLRDTSREAREIFEVIDDNVATTRRLLDDLLDISRISRGKLRIEKERTDLCAVLRRAVRSAEEYTRQRRQHIVFTGPPHDVTVFGDATRIQQLFANLLNNASRYSPDDARIEITLTVNGEAEVRVRDRGHGISRDMLERIFDPFFQVDRGESTSEGLGIGLALAKEIVAQHDGTIRAESNGLGSGSEFVVRLPLDGNT